MIASLMFIFPFVLILGMACIFKILYDLLITFKKDEEN